MRAETERESASGCRFDSPPLYRKHLLFTRQLSWSQTRWKTSCELIRAAFAWESMGRKSENGSLRVWRGGGGRRCPSCSLCLVSCFSPLNLFLRWRAKWRTKAASVSTRILCCRLLIFFSTSEIFVNVNHFWLLWHYVIYPLHSYIWEESRATPERRWSYSFSKQIHWVFWFILCRSPSKVNNFGWKTRTYR